MTGGSTIVEFWRDEETAHAEASRMDEILLLKQAVLDIEDSEEPAGRSERAIGIARVAFVLAGIAWIAFCGWAILASGGARPAASALPAIVASALIPLILLGVAYLLLARNSRTESRRYLDTARALRTEADLLELRLGRISDQLEAARQSMQDQAALLDNYGAAASSNMEASADLIAARAAATMERAAQAERASAALAGNMNSLIAAMPDLEERAARMAGQMMDNGHALSERIDTLEARLHALTELSDDARSRTLAATKSLTSQLTQLQESTRAASDEVTGMAEIAAGRIGVALTGAKSALATTGQGLDDHAAALEALVERSQANIHAIGQAAIGGFTDNMTAVETRLQQRMDVLLNSTQATLGETGRTLEEQADALDALVARSQASMEATGDATVSTFADTMTAVETRLHHGVDSALKSVQTALATTGQGLEAHSATLDALIDRSQTSIETIGSAAVAGLTENMNEVETRLHQLSGLIEGQQTLMAGLNDSLIGNIDTAEGRFAALEASALTRSERLSDALARLTSETQRIDGALASGGLTAEKMIGCAESLLVALDSGVRELDETYPAALDRFDDRMDRTRVLLDSTAPEFERLEAISEALLGRTQEAEEMLRGQGRRLTEWLESTQSGLDANRGKVEQLRLALDEAHQGATRITEGAGPLLITALLRVKDTADQAAERARQALGRAIPEAAKALGDAIEQAMQTAIGDRVTAQIQHVAEVAEEAVKAAHQASDRLMRQLLTIADTSATIEQRIEEAERASETRDRDSFSRRSALLIESLNSTAIDVAKLLSNDVTDSSWSAYLKGDRGVFTRRAVKLLDAGEAREIALHYDADPEFRDHVNRYIHDFESMLRIILSARDGNALGVAILSSDMGKLYVALAQAIERLRQ